MRFIVCPSVTFPKIFWTINHICALPSACWLNKNYRTKFEIEEENTQLLNDRQDKLWKFWEISTKQIEENQRQSQIITGEHLPLWSLSLMKKIIFLIFTTTNDSLNLAHHLWMALSDLEKPIHNIFQKNISWQVCQHWTKTLWGILKCSMIFFLSYGTYHMVYCFPHFIVFC